MALRIENIKSIKPLTPLQEIQLTDVTMGNKIQDIANDGNIYIVNNVVSFEAFIPKKEEPVQYYCALGKDGEIYYTSSKVCADDMLEIIKMANERGYEDVGVEFKSIPNKKPGQANVLKCFIKKLIEANEPMNKEPFDGNLS